MRSVFFRAKISLYAAAILFPLFSSAQLKVGAEQLATYLPQLKGKAVALVVNQTSCIGMTLLPDTLKALNINVRKIFAPEHGFRGDHSAGAAVKSTIDERTGIPVISLYGKNKKPAPEDLTDVDIVVYDIQDVGVRFYTYISTLHYIMEACAENNKPLIVLDRPNPNGYYIDGPILDSKFSSFVGMDPVPLVYGMTVGEYSMMLNGEGWLVNKEKCNLKVIPLKEYTHKVLYKLPVYPSPNLQSMEAIYLYPTLGLFEGTDVSVGRGTDSTFEIIGKPNFDKGEALFTPRSILGKAEDPPYKGIPCTGIFLRPFADNYIINLKQLYLFWLQGFYQSAEDKTKFFTPFFDKLAGTDELRKQIIEGISIEKIRESWQPALSQFKTIRKKYLLYADFDS